MICYASQNGNKVLKSLWMSILNVLREIFMSWHMHNAEYRIPVSWLHIKIEHMRNVHFALADEFPLKWWHSTSGTFIVPSVLYHTRVSMSISFLDIVQSRYLCTVVGYLCRSIFNNIKNVHELKIQPVVHCTAYVLSIRFEGEMQTFYLISFANHQMTEGKNE